MALLPLGEFKNRVSTVGHLVNGRIRVRAQASLTFSLGASIPRRGSLLIEVWLLQPSVHCNACELRGGVALVVSGWFPSPGLWNTEEKEDSSSSPSFTNNPVQQTLSVPDVRDAV